jgi:hypothetical protein
VNERKDHLEGNVARLVQAGFGEGAQLDPLAKEQTWQQLATALRVRRRAAEFPDRAVALLGIMLLGAAVWLAIRVTGAGTEVSTTVPDIVIALPLALNLIFVPVAGLVILRRRRRHA